MDSKAISDIILNKRRMNSSDIDDLRELANKYPYAQLFTILYLKALSISNSFSFETELNKYAYKVTDRAKLYEIIHNKEEDIIQTVDTDDVESKQEEVPSEIIETIEENAEILNVVEEEPKPQENDIVEIDLEAEEEVVNVSAVEIADEHDEAVEQPVIGDIVEEVESEGDNEKSALELDILTSAIDNVYPYILEKEIAKVEKEPVEDKIEHEEPIEEPKQPEKTTSQLNSFSGWLTQGSQQKTIEIKVEKEVEKVDNKKKEELIDKFIEKNPSISRPKKEFFSASKKAQESMDESSLLYSETLANIFVLQGNLPLALKAYEQLCLTIPEKKLIFAKKIEELKNRINNLK